MWWDKRHRQRQRQRETATAAAAASARLFMMQTHDVVGGLCGAVCIFALITACLSYPHAMQAATATTSTTTATTTVLMLLLSVSLPSPQQPQPRSAAAGRDICQEWGGKYASLGCAASVRSAERKVGNSENAHNLRNCSGRRVFGDFVMRMLCVTACDLYGNYFPLWELVNMWLV